MVHDVANSRPASKEPCIYWSGDHCRAGEFFPTEDISCYHDGNCDGFGTCRGCTKYDQGGLKLGTVDSEGGTTQTPMNLQMYNIRARIKPCCFWDGSPDDFFKEFGEDDDSPEDGKLGPFYTSPFGVVSNTPDNFPGAAETKQTKCTLEEAAPWQVAFTEENPTAYGCNGAKPECPFYTGPKFTEVVDDKMDIGNRVTAKQVLELRFYSTNWKQFGNPREEWESRFDRPDIWAWVKDPNSTSDLPGKGAFDEAGNPLIQKVSIGDLREDTPDFVVGAPESISTGTPVVGGPPDFPYLVEELSLLSTGMEVLWPANTSPEEPFVRKTFTSGERKIFISALINSDRNAYAVNITENPQDGANDLEFIKKLQRTSPGAVISPFVSGLPGSTFSVPLVLQGKKDRVNQIKIFLDTGAEDGSMLTADVYVRHIFYHAEVAQTSFTDLYGHKTVDPWIDHFTRFKAEADFLHLTGKTEVSGVFWNTIAANGKKTMYAIEESKSVEAGSNNPDVSWEPIGCGGHIAVNFLDPNISRVFPWKAWGNDSLGIPLHARMDRSGNDDLVEGESQIVDLEMVFASTKGTAIPANMAIFKPIGNEAVQPFNPDQDVLSIRYVYTKYRQGPIKEEDKGKLKFQEDLTKVIDSLVYDHDFDNSGVSIEGSFIKAGNSKLYSCDQILGDCFTEKSFENEGKALDSFFSGGLKEEEIKGLGEMLEECKERFNNEHSEQTFEDGTPVSFSEAANRLADKYLLEGTINYSFVFSDEDGRPIGTKNVGFLTQSTHVQSRDVEIRYKWGAQVQHYQVHHSMNIQAIFYSPTFATQHRLLSITEEYDPFCGDHAETERIAFFRAFDLSTDDHGALWYPYKRCLKPQYHVNNEDIKFVPVVPYESTVEGFDEGKRPYYWERMRFWDEYTPIIMDFIPQIGCFWSERTTTLNANRPVFFTGYTKIRSGHPFGAYATDREVIRVSRHWQKKNLNVKEETITQEDDGLSLSLTDEFANILYDEEGNLNSDADTQTPVWVHINDGMSVVDPGSEQLTHPFGRFLLNRTGSHSFSEQFDDTRVAINNAFVEKDYTSNLDRSEDGSQVYLADGTVINDEDGIVSEDKGNDIRWVFKEQDTGWAWAASPPSPERGSPLITGLFISNPSKTYFKKNRTPATFTTEGNHILRYRPHQFNNDGEIVEGARLDLDGGPVLYISQTDGQIFILADSNSPYDPEEHEGEDYKFVMHGNGPTGIGILADNRGLQRYEVGGEKFATLAGVNINLVFDIDQLPHEVVDVRNIGRLSGEAQEPPEGEEGEEPINETAQIDEAIKEYDINNRSPVEVDLDFHGHYFVEKIIIDFILGGDYDVPVISVSGFPKEDGMADISNSEAKSLFPLTSYKRGNNIENQKVETQSFNVNQRLFSLNVSMGARLSGRKMNIQNIRIQVREHTERSEQVFLYQPRVQLSKANTGTHKPSDLEFYFQRSFPDHAKDYLSGQISLADLGSDLGTSVTKIAGTELKWIGRQVKDLIPIFDFTDPINNRFPYDNIDISAIPGYVEEDTGTGSKKYIGGPVRTSSKGWTIHTTRHYSDPSTSENPTDSGPGGQPNVQREGQPNEDLQEFLYQEAGSLLGDKFSVYNSFWHPDEIEYFSDSGVDLEQYSWQLVLRSEAAPIERVFRHEDYGCVPNATNENLDGFVHEIPNWQAKGVFHYSCDARYSHACFTTVMNKCNEFIFDDFGTTKYQTTDVVDRFTYTFQFPPNDYQSYFASGLINKNEIGGIVGGTGGFGIAQASSPAPRLNQLQQKYSANQPVQGPGEFQ